MLAAAWLPRRAETRQICMPGRMQNQPAGSLQKPHSMSAKGNDQVPTEGKAENGHRAPASRLSRSSRRLPAMARSGRHARAVFLPSMFY